MIINRATLIALMATAWKLLGGPITLLIISKYLTEHQLGVYFTFIAVAAIQQVFEMGFSVALVQRYSSRKDENKNRVLFNSSIILYMVLSVVFLIVSFFYGKFIFSVEYENLEKIWIQYISIIALSLLLNPFYSYIEGASSVERAYKMKLIGSITTYLSLWIFVVNGFDLYAMVYSQLIGVASQIIIGKCFTLYLENKVILSRKAFVSELKGIADFQIKLMIIWITGYFYWNSYNVLIFKYIDAGSAGKFGLTFSIINSLSILAQTLIVVRRVEISKLISEQQYTKARKIFVRLNFLSCLSFVIGSSVLLIGIFNFHDAFFVKKILSLSLLVKLLLVGFLVTIICNMATYFRTFGKEYLFKLSLIMNILTPMISLGLLSRGFMIDTLINGILILHLFYVLIALMMFKGFGREFRE